METIRITYGSDTVTMTWDGAQASAPIRLDGQSTQYQTADARHLKSEAVRLMAALAWPETGSRPSDWDEGTELWDELAYETVEEEEEES